MKNNMQKINSFRKNGILKSGGEQLAALIQGGFASFRHAHYPFAETCSCVWCRLSAFLFPKSQVILDFREALNFEFEFQ